MDNQELAEAIERAVNVPFSVHILDSVDSTNTRLKQLAANGAPDGYVLIAKTQTAGRGRMGRSFVSPKSGLYLSLLLRPKGAAQESLFCTTAAACAVCRAIERTSPQKAAIKWVNDIYIGNKKVCGILAESVISGEKADSIVIGIGVNLSEPENGFAPEIADRACAVFKTAPDGYFQTLTIALLNELYAALNSPKEEILNAYRERSLVIGREVIAVRGDKENECFVIGLTDKAELIVEYPDRSRGVLNSGEVRVKL